MFPQIIIMDSTTLAQYLEKTDSISKPWLLVQLRLQKLQEQQDELSENDYAETLADIHEDLMNLGEWWLGIEDKVF
jgi:predicted house-cleaning noncanonical NTP pyrophosphatase (MazG superfamily)